MRIAALVLTVLAALACLWFFAVSEMLVRPGSSDTILHDDYYAVAHARLYLPYAMLALFNGALTLALWQRPRRWGLWLVLAGGFLALTFTMWTTAAEAQAMSARIPTFFDAAGGGDPSFESMLFWLDVRRWLVRIALGVTLLGWGAWLIGRFARTASQA